jgi:excisionase family DNA binding protein
MRILTVGEAASMLGCRRTHIYYLIRMSRLDAVKVRWALRISAESAEEYVQFEGLGGEIAVDLERGGSGRPLAGVTAHDLEGDPGRQAYGIPSGGTVEHPARGFHFISGAKRRHIKPVPGQLELFEGIDAHAS